MATIGDLTFYQRFLFARAKKSHWGRLASVAGRAWTSRTAEERAVLKSEAVAILANDPDIDDYTDIPDPSEE